MFNMFNRFFTALAVLFGAAEKGAQALDHVASIAEEKARGYRDEERLKLNVRLKQLERDLAAQVQAIAA